MTTFSHVFTSPEDRKAYISQMLVRGMYISNYMAWHPRRQQFLCSKVLYLYMVFTAQLINPDSSKH